MSRLLVAVLLVVAFSACDSDDSATGPTTPDLVDLDGDGYDDRDLQFLLDLLANNPDLDLDPTELGDQEWQDGRLVEFNTRALSGGTRVEGLQGPLPGSIGFLTRVRRLAILDQDFQGTIPTTVGSLRNVERLYLSGNGLSGEIPAVLAQLPKLQILSLSGNRLTGEIPPELAARPLTSLGLSFNQLSGPIPSFNFENLVALILSGNRLTGQPLDQIVDAPELKIVYLSDNEFGGTFPAALLEASPWTIDIALGGNHFEGVIPAGVCERFQWDGRAAGYSRLDGNAFCPPYPPCLEPWQIGEQDCEESP